MCIVCFLYLGLNVQPINRQNSPSVGGGTRSASGSSGGGVSKKSSPETGVPYTGHNYDHNTTYASIREMYADMHYHPDFPTPPLDPVYPFLGQLVYLYGVYMHSFHMHPLVVAVCVYGVYMVYIYSMYVYILYIY